MTDRVDALVIFGATGGLAKLETSACSTTSTATSTTTRPTARWRRRSARARGCWADVPIMIRAGKCMPVTSTEITWHDPTG